MLRSPRSARRVFLAAALAAAISSDGFALSHLWRIHEVFSNRDGTIQFIELFECCGSPQETFMRGLEVTSLATDSVFTFPADLTAPTSNRYLLVATRRFADLPGAPRPDFVLPDRFLGLSGDTIWYAEDRNYDRFIYGDGDLPLDGVLSIQVTDHTADEFTTAKNSPTNFAGETGTVDASDRSFSRGDCNADGTMDLSDAVFVLGGLFLDTGAPPCGDACDTNDDGALDVSDAVNVLLSLFVDSRPLPAPVECGDDATPDALSCLAFAECP